MNAMQYNGVDDLLEKAQSTVDAESRVKIYQQIQKRIAEDCPFIPLAWETEYLATLNNIDLGKGIKDGKLACPYNHWYWIEEIRKK
jgi:ABC-type transport system substrate-binding protein